MHIGWQRYCRLTTLNSGKLCIKKYKKIYNHLSKLQIKDSVKNQLGNFLKEYESFKNMNYVIWIYFRIMQKVIRRFTWNIPLFCLPPATDRGNFIFLKNYIYFRIMHFPPAYLKCNRWLIAHIYIVHFNEFFL